jgi:hypothetical protein
VCTTCNSVAMKGALRLLLLQDCSCGYTCTS